MLIDISTKSTVMEGEMQRKEKWKILLKILFQAIRIFRERKYSSKCKITNLWPGAFPNSQWKPIRQHNTIMHEANWINLWM